MAHFALRPGDELQRAARLVAARVHQLLVRHGVTLEAIRGQRVDVFRRDKSGRFRFREGAFDVVQLDPILRRAMAEAESESSTLGDFYVERLREFFTRIPTSLSALGAADRGLHALLAE